MTAGAQLTQDIEELLRFVQAEACRGLVEDDDPRVHRNRARQLDDLLLGDAKMFDRGIRIALEVEPVESRDGGAASMRPVDQSGAAAFAPENDVLHGGELRNEAELLMHH